jgi:hypothetical protein
VPRLRKLTKHRVSIPHPVGLSGKPIFPLTQEYAKCALLMHKPWTSTKILLFEKKANITAVEEYLAYIQDDNCSLHLKTTYEIALAMYIRDQCYVDINDMKQYDSDDMDSDTEDIINAYGSKSAEAPDDEEFDFVLTHDWSQSQNIERDVTGPGETWLKDTICDIRSKSDTKSVPLKKDGSSYKIEDVLSSDEQSEIVFMVLDKLKEWIEYEDECDIHGRTTDFEPLRMTVQGPGGTGKSFVINVIVTAVESLFPGAKVSEVVAPTGAAAYNVGGKTFHSTLLLNWKKPWRHLGPEKLERLKKTLLRTLVLIIDERSLVSMELLGSAKRNVQNSAHGGTNRDRDWGGIPIVIALGDDHQLPSINPGATSILVQNYSPTVSREHQSIVAENIGREAFLGLAANVKELKQSRRIASDSDDLKQITTALRTEEGLDESQVEQLLSLKIDNPKLSSERRKYVEDKGIWVFYKRRDCASHNKKMLKKIHSKNNPVARIYAKVTQGRGKHFKKREQSDRNFDAAIGCRVAVDPDNLCALIGLYHGALGTIIEIVYAHGQSPNAKQFPLYIVVEMDRYTGPVWDKKHPKQIPIGVTTKVCDNDCCILQYIPLSIAFGKTLHTFQGQEIVKHSIQDVMVFECETLIIESKYPGWLYTGISRVDSIGNGDIEVSSLYFIPGNARENRFINVRTKQHSNDNYKRVDERDAWISYLDSCKKTVTFSMSEKETLMDWANSVEISSAALDEIISFHNNT